MHLLKTKKGIGLCVVLLCTIVFVTLFGLSTSTSTVHAAPPPSPAPLSQSDITFLRSLIPQQSIQFTSNSSSKATATQALDNAARVQAALKQPNLSDTMRSALELIPTSVTSGPGNSSAQTQLPPAQPQATSCTQSSTADHTLTETDAVGLTLWTYEVAQTFFFNQGDICSYYGRNPIITVPSPWSLANEAGDLGSCCPTNVGVLVEQNNAIFQVAVPGLINATLQTSRGNILYKFGGDGTWSYTATITNS